MTNRNCPLLIERCCEYALGIQYSLQRATALLSQQCIYLHETAQQLHSTLSDEFLTVDNFEDDLYSGLEDFLQDMSHLLATAKQRCDSLSEAASISRIEESDGTKVLDRLKEDELLLVRRSREFLYLFSQRLAPEDIKELRPTQEAQRFWNEKFGATTKRVPWVDFFYGLRHYLKRESMDINEKVFKAYLDFTRSDHVSKFEFLVFLKWFGPIDRIYSNFWDIVSNSWFFGFLSLASADALLREKREGTYLLRFSNTKLGKFAIDFKKGNDVNHCLVESTFPYGYCIMDKAGNHETIADLVDAYKKVLRLPFSPMESGGDSCYATPQLDTTSRENLCKVCFEKVIDCVFLPCGHLVCCQGCATKLIESDSQRGGLCVVCRGPLVQFNRIYSV